MSKDSSNQPLDMRMEDRAWRMELCCHPPCSILHPCASFMDKFPSTKLGQGLRRIVRVPSPAQLLALGIVFYALVFTAAAWYKYSSYWMGFDLGVHEQVLWNTAHGRIAASSPSVGTQSYFGIDIIVTELLLTPLYAL